MSDIGRVFCAICLSAVAAGALAQQSDNSVDGNGRLEADWFFQASGAPLAERARKEIHWARELAVRLQKAPAARDLTAELKELARIEQEFAGKLPKPLQSLVLPARDASSLPDGLVARWSFDDDTGGTIKDASGHGRDGRVIGIVETRLGAHGRGEFNGRSAVDTGLALSGTARGSYTITAWMKTTGTEEDILGSGVGTGHFLLMSYRGVVRGHQWTAGQANVIDGTTVVNDGRWHHVAQVVDTDRIMLYVDGALDAAAEFKGQRVTADAPVVIGARSRQPGSYSFAGALDEVCVFERALSADTIKAEFQAGRSIQDIDQGINLPDGPAKDFYLAVRRVKRRIMFSDPAVDFKKVLFVDNPYPTGGEWPHQARHRDGMMAVAGGRLLILDGLHPGGKPTQLAPAADKQASFWRPDLSFDAKKVLFCMKPAEDKSFHLYEIGCDGSGLRQLTNSDYDDLDPIYMPDGHIMFSSTRCNTYIRCMPYTYCYVLARCDADGKNIFLISRNNECDWLPALLNDGRVIYSRWEYHDKALWRIQSLWTTNQDGTGVVAFWGNQSVWPDHLAEARSIPNSHRVMFTGLAHHDWFAGSIGILDTSEGFNFPGGLTKVTADVDWPECGRPPFDPVESPSYHSSGPYAAYKSPYPLSERLFLVSARPAGRTSKFSLYLMDVDGNRELIYSGKHNIWHAMPVKPRMRPPAKPDVVKWPAIGKPSQAAQPGVLINVDVYEGVNDLPRGKARYLRVIQMDHRTYSTWTRDGRFSGPVVSAIQDDGVKRVLGTAEIEEDGSVAVEVPPGQALHLQLLDDHYRALQTMRSFTGVMPGERRGCIGCHEMQKSSGLNKPVMATSKPPQKLTPPPWGAEVSIGYERLVQPVLDKHCGECHQGDGKGRKELDLTLRQGSGPFKQPYLSLVGQAQYFRLPEGAASDGIAGAIMAENYSQSDPDSYVTLPPMKYLSYTSKLIEICMSGEHHDVKITGADLRQLIGWIDCNCPYRGDEEVRQIPDPDPARYANLPILPRTTTAPRIDRFNVPQDELPQGND